MDQMSAQPATFDTTQPASQPMSAPTAEFYEGFTGGQLRWVVGGNGLSYLCYAELAVEPDTSVRDFPR